MSLNKYLHCAVISLLLLPFFASSQVIEWQNTIGGNNYDPLHSISQTDDGGFILGGWSYSGISGDKTEDNLGITDYWLVKTDAAGNIEWENTMGGSIQEYMHKVEQTPDGGYIIAGHSDSDISGDKTENSYGAYDYWIVKTDASGTIQWQNTIGGTGNDEIYDLIQTADGGYILAGNSTSDISGDKTENCWGVIDLWIVKIDSSGTVQWDNTIGGNSNDFLWSIKATSDGGCIIAASSMSGISGDKTENYIGTNSNFDYWLVKLDSSGQVQWDNTIGGFSEDRLMSIDQTTDGGYILGGHSNSGISGDKTEWSYGYSDYWIVKVDSSGVVQWDNTIGGNSNDDFFFIEESIYGGFILCGTSRSGISGDKTENTNGDYDYWIVKTDDSGIIQWQNTIGGSGEDKAIMIEQTSDGNFIIGGYSASGISGDKTEICFGDNDYWIVKMTDHYNNITGKLFIDINNSGIQEAGEPLLKHNKVIESNSARFDFSDQSGMYDVSVLSTGTFSVAPVAINYYSAVPSSHIANFPAIHLTDSLNDFAFQPAGVFNDLCITLTPLTPFRSGFTASYFINYTNPGTTALTPTIIFYNDFNLNFISSTPSANFVAIDSVVWNLGTLNPYEEGSIILTLNVASGLPNGVTINSSVVVEPIAGDANTSCNYSSWNDIITGSFDPNDIRVDQDTLFSTLFPNPPHLEYIIRFQNTGNDTAFTVKIYNPIDTNLLDLSTIEFVASSHPVDLSWNHLEKLMQYTFNNILLPDSNVNEPESHGFIRYRIKPKSTLSVGDSITNYAAIYFDLNAPIITNTAVTHIVLPTSLHEISATSDQLVLYPNPANSMLNIETGDVSAVNSILIISDAAGRTILSKTISSTSTKEAVDISSFSQGLYIVQMSSGEKILRGRFVKN